jgi:hypothetical protein
MDTRDVKREPYEPPSIEDIPLYPEETVLAGCKLSTGPASSVGGFNICSICMGPAPS